jgi:hypothetical protein
LHRVGKAPDVGQARKIRWKKSRRTASFLYLGDDALAPLPIPAVHENAHPVCA